MTGEAGSFFVGEKYKLRIIVTKIIALAIAALVLAGCNTISGVGKDVQKAGQIITGAGGK
jgi:predicted small secreted protein